MPSLCASSEIFPAWHGHEGDRTDGSGDLDAQDGISVDHSATHSDPRGPDPTTPDALGCDIHDKDNFASKL